MAKAPRKKSQERKPSKANKSGKTGSKVEIFTASFCPHCRDAKAYFKACGIPFVEYNLERSQDAEKRFRSYGGKAIPLIIVNGSLLRRWDMEAFEKLYRS
jgi:glutaredoxin